MTMAGSFTNESGQTQSVLRFTELYTATFARRVCRALMASQAAQESSNCHFIFVEDLASLRKILVRPNTVDWK